MLNYHIEIYDLTTGQLYFECSDRNLPRLIYKHITNWARLRDFGLSQDVLVTRSTVDYSDLYYTYSSALERRTTYYD